MPAESMADCSVSKLLKVDIVVNSLCCSTGRKIYEFADWHACRLGKTIWFRCSGNLPINFMKKSRRQNSEIKSLSYRHPEYFDANVVPCIGQEICWSHFTLAFITKWIELVYLLHLNNSCSSSYRYVTVDAPQCHHCVSPKERQHHFPWHTPIHFVLPSALILHQVL